MTPVTFFSLCLCSLWLGCESDPLLVVDFNEVFALSDISLRTGIAVDSRSETLFVTSNGYILTEDADSAEWELFTLWSRPDGSGVTARDVAFSAATGRVVALGGLRHSPVATFDPDTGEMGPPVPVPEDVLPLEAPRLLAISDARPDVAWIVDGEIGVVEMNLSTRRTTRSARCGERDHVHPCSRRACRE